MMFIFTLCLMISTGINYYNENKERKYKELIVEELVDIYGSEQYTYTIEELKVDNKEIKYACIIKFYDGTHYTERIMYVDEDEDDADTEETIIDINFKETHK